LCFCLIVELFPFDFNIFFLAQFKSVVVVITFRFVLARSLYLVSISLSFWFVLANEF
jgi:hypothetical protein